jgi:hypothetical protein
MKPGDLAKYASELERQAAIGALVGKVLKGAAGVGKELASVAVPVGKGGALAAKAATGAAYKGQRRSLLKEIGLGTASDVGTRIKRLSTPAKVVGAAGAGYVAAKAT